jgi:hypothetical protein
MAFKVDVIQFLECPLIFDLLMMQETTLFLQLLYKNEFKDDFLLVLKNKYEDMIISAVHDKYYLENYKHLDTNLDRGVHIFHLLYDMRSNGVMVKLFHHVTENLAKHQVLFLYNQKTIFFIRCTLSFIGFKFIQDIVLDTNQIGFSGPVWFV